ncbi:VOC family protein [Pendulispora rubella]|uniref:VOC family protein n=1 Tax=Pendulispora rubella TaxID=2741070 RepID=A0ABZ2L2E5_9BACT
MHRSRLSTLVLDCRVDDIDEAARFWGQALGRSVAPLRSNSGDFRDLTTLPLEPSIVLQKVQHESRIHLDIETDDLDAEVRRLEALGAKRIAFVKQKWWVMEAPTGQRFCVVNRNRGPLIERATTWP